MTKKILIAIIFLSLIIPSLLPAPNAAAKGDLSDIYTLYDAFANVAGLPNKSKLISEESSLEFMIAKILSAIMGFLGVLFLALTVWGGIRWMWARGNEEEAKKAKDIIKDALIGLAIVLTSYVIAMGITFYLTLATGTAY